MGHVGKYYVLRHLGYGTADGSLLLDWVFAVIDVVLGF